MRLLLLPLLVAVAACGTTQTSMSYAPTVRVRPVAAASPVVAVSGQVANLRHAGREDPNWIGTIRGGYGNPLKRLSSDVPVDQVVGQAFAAGLPVRGLHAPGTGASPYVLAVTIHQFDANQYVRREATAEDLRQVALRTMSEAVDALLDKPGFRTALRRA